MVEGRAFCVKSDIGVLEVYVIWVVNIMWLSCFSFLVAS